MSNTKQKTWKARGEFQLYNKPRCIVHVLQMINKTITNQEFGPMEIGDRNAWDKYKARLTRRYQQSPYTTPQKFLRTLFRKRLA